MNVSLTEELEELVQEKVRSGLYSSASEVIRQALRLLKEQDQVRQMRLEELRKEVAIGIEQIERGQVVPFDAEAIIAEGKARLARMKGRQ
jgi:antitoxin ParD1/3/4